MPVASDTNSPRQRARLKACRLRGGDACPCHGTECRLHAASFSAILPPSEIGTALNHSCDRSAPEIASQSPMVLSNTLET